MTQRCHECGYVLSAAGDCPRCKGLEIGKWSNGRRPGLAARLRAGKTVEGIDRRACLILIAVVLLGAMLWCRSR
jgi:hypothetical protein